MINFLNLEYFLVAAEELNFTKAAKKLFISQQSLSNHISNMERVRCHPLQPHHAPDLNLCRSGIKGQSPPDAGAAGRDLPGAFRHQRFLCRPAYPGALPHPRTRHPAGNLTGIQRALSKHRLKAGGGQFLRAGDDLLHGNIDLIIDMLPFKVENVETVPICEEEILLAVPDSVLEHAFPGRLKEIKKQLSEHTDLKLLANCPFLLINKGNRVRTIADEMFEEAQITPNIVLETENIQTVLALAEKGMGITFYPRMFISGQTEVQELKNGQGPLNFYSLEHPKAHGVLAIGYHKGHYMSQATKEFIQTAKETI